MIKRQTSPKPHSRRVSTQLWFIVAALLIAAIAALSGLLPNRLLSLLPVVDVLAAEGTLPVVKTFDSMKEKDELVIDLKTVSPSLPADWTGHESLVLELRASSPQRMHLKIVSGTDASGRPRFSQALFHPYANVWIRAAIPLRFLSEPPKTGIDMAAVGNRSLKGYFMSLWGPFVPLTDVSAIAFEMDDPVGSPTLEIRSIALAKESPGDAILEGNPVVDRLGQARNADWPGKAKDLDGLKTAWQVEDSALKDGDFGYCTYGGYLGTSAKATGFFRVEKIDGRWWFIDPDGHYFLSVGCDVIRTEMTTRKAGREDLFEQIPDEAVMPGRRPGSEGGLSFFTANLRRRFGDTWEQKWADMTFRRMGAWGLNTVANWSDEVLWEAKRKPYVIPLRDWQTQVSYLGLPDVYSQEFTDLVDARAKEQCTPRKNDPWLLGYFLANEPPFPQKELQTVDLILEGPETDIKAVLQKYLMESDTPERRKEFIGRAFDRYIQVTSAAVKKYDPNHLNLGMRGGGRPTDAEIDASRAFDVYSVNIYSPHVSKERVSKISELTGKPVIIGEFHFGTPGRGLAASLVQVKNQQERGTAYRYYVEQAFSMPELIGTHWFQWADQPTTGRFDGEDYNIGLVDVTDRPYPEMIEALVTTHKRLQAVHGGTAAPFATEALVK